MTTRIRHPLRLIVQVVACAALALAACDDRNAGSESEGAGLTKSESVARAGAVTTARLEAEAAEGRNWLVKGGRLTGEHFSPLDQINTENVDALGLAWAANVPSPIGLAAEPIVVDGVAYVSAPLSVVYAFDAATGKQLWRYEPELDLTVSFTASLSARWNRGVAVWDGLVIVGTGDCRLIAIDAGSGKQRWDAPACDPRNGIDSGGLGAGITGAPLVADDKVFIGYQGSDAGARGSIGAFGVATGRELWRFWTVPGDPNGPDGGLETDALRRAAETWTGGWAKQGGGVVWNSIHYDPVTGFVIFGTATGMPMSPEERGPGDNLYTNSVLALDADTGAYQWHYQTVPADAWNLEAVMPKIVTDIQFDGKNRRVVFEAPKNGFFYVLDAYTGDLLAADRIGKVTWASHIDLETGRPVRLPEAQWWERGPSDPPAKVYPSAFGTRNWEPMAYSPITRLVYMPVAELFTPFCHDGPTGSCSDFNIIGLAEDEDAPAGSGQLLAWDPVAREARWSAPLRLPFNSGVLVTAGNLVFQGEATGELQVRDARTGELLWSRRTGPSIQAAPVSYEMGGVQYVLVASGSGGGARLLHAKHTTTSDSVGPSRLLAFKLNGASEVPIVARAEIPVPEPPELTAATDRIENGEKLYGACAVCHGEHAVALGKVERDGAMPDLRYSPYLQTASGWKEVVFDDALFEKGMPAMAKTMGMSVDDVEAIRAFVIHQAWKAYGEHSQ